MLKRVVKLLTGSEINKKKLKWLVVDLYSSPVIRQEIAERLLSQLDFIHLKPKKILQLDEHDLDFTKRIKQRFPKARVTSTFPTQSGKIDLVIANLYLHRIQDLPAYFAKIQTTLQPHGLLLFSCFGPDSLHTMRTSSSPFPDMHDLGDMLVQQYFADPVVNMETLTVTYEDATEGWQALDSMNEDFGLLEKAHPQPFMFEIIYGHAWRGQHPSQSTNQDGTVYVDIESLLNRKP